MISFTRTDQWWERAQKCIPYGCNTMSKHISRFPSNYPKVLGAGRGCKVVDMDRNTYIDWIGALGANILGYVYPLPSYESSVKPYGVYSLTSFLEIELAETLTRIIPCCDMVRYGKNGVDATMAAVRLARAVTGRDMVISYGYHGWTDQWGITGAMIDGIPRNNGEWIEEVQWGELEILSMKLARGDVACVIMEVPPDTGEDQAAFLKAAIDVTHEHGALFILDEIVTGFRYSIGGAHKLYGVSPDLVCIGKAMANGLPISAVCGKREYMQHFSADTDPAVFYSTTFAGETSSIMAAIETIEVIETEKVVEHIWHIGKLLRDGMRDLASQYGIRLDMPGNPARSLINLLDRENNPSLLLKSIFLQMCCQDGVLFGVPVFPTFSHTVKDVDVTLAAVDHAFKLLAKYRGHEQDLLVGSQMAGTFVRSK